MVESSRYDVFLAYNSVDKPQVRAIAEELKGRGLKPWLDEEQMAPGDLSLEAIQKASPQIKAVAICIGTTGLGKWQVRELQVLISQFVEKSSPVIPLLLPGVERMPGNLLFLQQFNWVDFKRIDDAEAFFKLEWRITGSKPKQRSTLASYSFSQDENVAEFNPQVEDKSQLTSGEIVSRALRVGEFKVVTVSQEVQREGILGLSAKVILKNYSRSCQAQYFSEDLGNGVELEMVFIPGGQFSMGSSGEELKSDKEEKPQHQVNVSSFYLGRYPITQAQWREVASWEQVERELNPEPSYFKDDYKGIDRWTRPVEQVSWLEAKEFCARLSKKTNQKYRLPTEAEWEYACRAGTRTAFHFGETMGTELANYDGNYNYGQGVKGQYRRQTTPVGYFEVANAFGLSDLHGNVCEWCEDDWYDNYEGAPLDGSAWLLRASRTKVIRGGAWYFNPDYCRSASRDHDTCENRYSLIGFRVVCVA